MKSRNKFNNYFFCILFICILIALDQYTKHLTLAHLKGNAPIDIIEGVLQLTYVGNKGIAWGMLWGKVNFVLILTIIISLIIFYMIIKLQMRIGFYVQKVSDTVISKKIKMLKLFQISLMVMFSGAIGNIIDRVRLGYVVDFIYFELIDFPVFNVADIYVTMSMIAFILLYFFKIDENEVFALFKKGKKWE